MKKFAASALLAAALFAVVLAPHSVRADNVNIVYFTISSNDPDANHLCCGVSTNEVMTALGPHGLPVLNPAMTGAPVPTDVNADGELTYWSPTFNPNVTQTGTAVVALPFNVPVNFFPPNGTGTYNGGANGYQAAYLYGTLVAPTDENISFSIGSDDMAFAYLDGQLVCDDGGVHGSTAVPCTSPGVISAGPHSLQLFFVDINQVQSGLTFSVTTQGVTTTAVEPGTITLFGAGLFSLMGVIRKRARK